MQKKRISHKHREIRFFTNACRTKSREECQKQCEIREDFA